VERKNIAICTLCTSISMVYLHFTSFPCFDMCRAVACEEY